MSEVIPHDIVKYNALASKHSIQRSRMLGHVIHNYMPLLGLTYTSVKSKGNLQDLLLALSKFLQAC